MSNPKVKVQCKTKSKSKSKSKPKPKPKVKKKIDPEEYHTKKINSIIKNIKERLSIMEY